MFVLITYCAFMQAMAAQAGTPCQATAPLAGLLVQSQPWREQQRASAVSQVPARQQLQQGSGAVVAWSSLPATLLCRVWTVLLQVASQQGL